MKHNLATTACQVKRSVVSWTTNLDGNSHSWMSEELILWQWDTVWRKQGHIALTGHNDVVNEKQVSIVPNTRPI